MQALLILCQRRDVEHLLAVVEDWEGDVNVVMYGYTNKLQDGFLLIHWTTPITETFQRMQLKADPGILDYVIYDLSPQSPPTPATL